MAGNGNSATHGFIATPVELQIENVKEVIVQLININTTKNRSNIAKKELPETINGRTLQSLEKRTEINPVKIIAKNRLSKSRRLAGKRSDENGLKRKRSLPSQKRAFRSRIAVKKLSFPGVTDKPTLPRL
ncbi:MAG: hypothetical protein LKG11_04885 [Bacilli bacterium]|jgi:hypothetical protein|nr:hypothetical protein [Bacilli bacterium]